MTADAYIVGYLAERLDTRASNELRAAALPCGYLGRGLRLTFAGHLRACAREHVTTDPQPLEREDSP